MKISDKLRMGMLVMLGVLVLNVAITICLAEWIIRGSTHLVEVRQPLAHASLQMQINIGETARVLLDYIRDEKERDISRMSDTEHAFDLWVEESERLAETEEERALGQSVATLYRPFKGLRAEITSISKLQNSKLLAFRSDIAAIDALLDEKLGPAIDRSATNAATKLEAVLNMEVNTDEAFGAINGYLLVPDPALIRQIADSEAGFKHFEAQYRGVHLSADEERLLDKIAERFAETVTAGKEIIALTNRLREKLGKFEADLKEIERILQDQLQNLIHKETERVGRKALRSGQIAVTVILIVALVVFSIVVVVSRAISKEIVDGVTRLTEGANEFGKGHLDHHIEIGTEDELGELAAAFNKMSDERKQAEKEKRKLEILLRQQQKLEAIGTLAGGVAHEINNPITGITNYARLIGERLDPESPLREFTDGITEESERITTIVRNLLSFARQEKESHSLARIVDIVNGTVSLIQTILRGDQISLKVDVPDGLPRIKCRSQQIQQVLMNLLTNARDALNERYAGHDPDKIMIVTARVLEKENQPWIRVTVEDHGAGISDEIRERVFDPFFTTKDRTKGTGLGLSISHGIVQDHRGELSVECEAGRYVRFHLDLPVDNGWSLHEASEETMKGTG